MAANGPRSHGPVPRRRRRNESTSESALLRASSSAARAELMSAASALPDVGTGGKVRFSRAWLRSLGLWLPMALARVSPAAGGGGRPSK
eukprot:scaffold174518_cov31-Tisochrysis_lutea.AAC.8